MPKTLRLLILEDSPEDAELAISTLERAGYACQWERVETREDFLERIESSEYDIVLSDYNLPSFDGLSALKLIVERGIDIPFLLLSGILGEEPAIESLKAGAADFVLKDKLFRLPFVVDRALNEKDQQRQNKRAEKERRVIFEIIEGIVTTPNLDAFLKLVHRSISQIVYAENCFVMLHDPDTDIIHYEFWADKHDPQPPRLSPPDKGFSSYVLRTGEPLLLSLELKKKMLEAGDAEEIGNISASWVGVPLRTSFRTIGVLVLQHYEDENAYSQRDLEFLTSVGDQIALAIERKRAEEALSKSESLYHTLFDSAPEGIVIANAENYYLDANARACQMFGYTRDEFIGLHASKIVTETEIPNIGESLSILKAGSAYNRTWQLRRKDDSEFVGETIASLLPDGNRIILIRDITESNRMTNALSDSEERYRELIENAVDLIYTHDLEGNYTSVNRAGEKLTGYSRDEALSMTLDQFVAPEYLEKAKKMRSARFAGEDVPAYELELIRKDGRRVAVELNTRIIYKGRVPVGVQGVARDITERKQAERAVRFVPTLVFAVLGTFVALFFLEILEYILDPFIGEVAALFTRFLFGGLIVTGTALFALKRQALLYRRTLEEIKEREQAEESRRESDERYRDLVENAIDIIYSHDLAGNFTSVNRAGEKIMGYTREESLTMNLAEVVAPEYREKAEQMIAAKLSGEDVSAYDLEVIAKDGSRIKVEINTRVIYENGVPVSVQGIARDITERKQLEDQFRQAQKMESIGILAGGIAHDFNNLLTVINGYSDFALRKLNTEDPIHRHITEIKNAGNRAAGLTSQLLAFSRKQVLKPIVHNINSTISNVEQMLRRIIRESIEIRIVLDSELGNIKADPGQIEQVIMNLAVNASDAMPNGGTLTVETNNVYLDEQYVRQHSWVAPGQFVKMTLTDTGEGMDEKTQKQIFEPFFTTKEIGKGTGLGLSTVYGIVKQSGGHIMVYSEPGHGTSFKIYLPCVDEIVQKPKLVVDREVNFSDTGTILLVEDEEIVRNLVREVLTSTGYVILEAPNGKAALSICNTYSEPINLLLTDVIMPKMSGPELKDHIVKLLPDIKVLFMSGYTDDTISQNWVIDEEDSFIEKPFTADDLCRKVREMMED